MKQLAVMVYIMLYAFGVSHPLTRACYMPMVFDNSFGPRLFHSCLIVDFDKLLTKVNHPFHGPILLGSFTFKPNYAFDFFLTIDL